MHVVCMCVFLCVAWVVYVWEGLWAWVGWGWEDLWTLANPMLNLDSQSIASQCTHLHPSWGKELESGFYPHLPLESGTSSDPAVLMAMVVGLAMGAPHGGFAGWNWKIK